ncbi:MAG TPA: RNA-binding protein [Candidatus Omnitrophota bacterium]|nr:RNA-binding protein [Candidatus Omnitrophota bacterium]HPN56627.1 RNA-binding protein [Candidatus Omnitrophota bacterium]
MKIYVGNFSYDVTEEELKTVFDAFGQVESAKIIKDKFTGESKGFGFVEMPDKTQAQAAMTGITEIKGRRVTINEARPQAKNDFRSSKPHGSRKPNSFQRERRY